MPPHKTSQSPERTNDWIAKTIEERNEWLIETGGRWCVGELADLIKTELDTKDSMHKAEKDRLEKEVGELRASLQHAVEEERLECAKVANEWFLSGTDGKNPDFACSTCGFDIRAACCVKTYVHNGNEAISKAIRQRGGGA